MNLTPLSPVFADLLPPQPTLKNADIFSDTAQPHINGSTGAFTQSFSLDIPPGRNSLQPDVTLDYSSQRTQDSIVGYGWQLSIPYIQRLNKTGSQDLYGNTPYFSSSIDGELVNASITSTTSAATTSPTILDTLPLTFHSLPSGTSQSFSYTVPAGGSNKLFVVLIGKNGVAAPTATLNGQSLSFSLINGSADRAGYYVGYLANPTSGTFQINFTATTYADYEVFTLQNAAQTNPIDVTNVTTANPVTSKSTTITTTQGNDFLASIDFSSSPNTLSSFGASETALIANDQDSGGLGPMNSSWKFAGTSAGTETMTTSWNSSRDLDEAVVAIKPYPGGALLAGSYMARIDSGSNNTYSFANNTWTVYDKHGTRYLFGSNDSGRQYDTGTGTSTKTYKWYLQEVRDTNGNYVKYTYNRDSNELYPNQIIYTGNGATDGPSIVTFATSTRPDVRISFAPGFKVTTNYRISEIDAAFNGSTVRKYLLGYGAGNNGVRSLLTSLQEQGYDQNNTLTTLPAMSFSYISTSTSFLSQNGASESSYAIADTNGNGVNDVSVMYGVSPMGGLINGTQLGSATPDYWAGTSTAPYNNYPPWERGVRFVDVNADGKADVARGYYDNSSHTQSTELLLNTYATSTGAYSWVSTSSSPTTIPTFAYSAGGTTGIFGDINGDGLSDFEQWLPGYAGQASYLGNGAGWTPDTDTFAPVKSFSTPSPTASMFIDINGDGLDDWVYSDGTTIYALLNTGTGWESSPESQWTIATSTLFQSPDSSTTYYDRGIRFLDINGDGLPDFIRSYASFGTIAATSTPRPEFGTTTAVFLNTGNGWATSTAYTLNPITKAQLYNGGWLGYYQYNEYANFIGNGQMAQDVLSTVTNPKGGRTSVTYSPSTQLSGNSELPYEMLVATAIGTYDNLGNAGTTTYSYSGGQQYFTLGVRDRKFAGFASSIATLPDSKVKTYFDQGVGMNTALGEQANGYAQINHPFRKDVLDLSSNLVQSNFYRWDSIARGSGSYFINLGRQVEQDYAADGTHRDKATDYFYSATTDDIIAQTDYGEVQGNSDGTFTDSGNDQRVTLMSYAASSSVNMSVLTEKKQLPATAFVKVLVVGGGGGGGRDVTSGTGAGGGGAGGYREDSSHMIIIQSYAVTVGSGGTGATVNSTAGTNGNNSVFDTLTAVGGGGGGGRNAAAGSGGSGGGGGYPNNGGAGTTGQGHNGGNTANSVGGGGGGATAAGQDGQASGGGNGGNGTASSISGSPVTYAGGGGAGVYAGLGTAGSGGSGGGGAGASGSGTGTAGAANTGGGGGGGGSGSGIVGSGGSGGSGVVIIAYPAGSITATGGTVTTANGYTIHTFTSNGTWTVTGISGAQTNATTTDTRFYYDNLPFGQVTAGNNTRQEDWISGNTFASSTKTYNTYGLVATSTDRRGYATGYKYDAFNLYVATATNPLGQQTQYFYNYSNGKTKQTTDPNNRVMKNIFDGVGRLTEVDQSDISTPSLLATSTTYQYTDNATAPSVVHRADYLTATNTVDTYDYYDGLNRLVQERKATQTAGTFAATDRIYNSAGLLGSQSLPYFSSGSSYTSPTSIGLLYTNYTYDPLKRALTTSNAVGTTTNVYAKRTTTTTDPNGNIKDYTLDAYGNLTTVVEHAFTLLTTTYSYDAANNLATTTDSAGNVRGFTYDGLNRRLTAQDLHAATHTPFGSWSYSYDDAGNMISQVDPKGSTTTRTYDALGRLLTETNAGATQVTNTYDSCTNGIGYLCTASSTAAKTQNSYDILGRISSATTTIAGLAFTSSSTYDRQGNVTNITYPNGSQVSYAYNLAGQPYRVQTKLAGGSWADIASSLVYAPQGVVTSALFGNGASSTWTFNANALYRLAALQTQGQGGTTIQNFSYTYDPAGNITQIANTASTTNSTSVQYWYDQLNRLTAASTTAGTLQPYLQSFSYDSLGNILSMTNGATTTAPSGPTILDTLPLTFHSLPSGTSQSFSYTVPAGGANKLFVLLMGKNDGTHAPSATLNGSSLTISQISGTADRAGYYVGYLANPSSGTFQVTFPGTTYADYEVFTLQNAAQSSPIDVSNVTNNPTASSLSTSVTTTQGSDFLASIDFSSSPNTLSSFGASETPLISADQDSGGLGPMNSSWKAAGMNAGTESMTTTWNSAKDLDEAVVAIKVAPTAPVGGLSTTTYYAYPQTGYMNPDAVGSIGNGVSTTTYAYDANGNLIQAGGWNYVWDYLNRMLASGYNNSTTTYAYDPTGARVLQTSTTSTTYYPNKYYSFASTKIGANTYATSTNYVWNGDTLLATIDQPMINGTATGTAITRYIHPDHLGSTNVVTDQNGSLVQLMDYYPYGATRIATSTYPTNEKRQYIGQFSDAQTNLNYLNARFYDSARGQFMSQDPEFLGTKQKLRNPQSLNPYSYANDNPITKEDPSGNAASLSSLLNQLASLLTQLYSALGSMNTASYSRGGSSGGSGGSSAPAATAKPQPPVGYGGGTTMNDYFNYQFSQAVKSYVGAPYNEKTDAVGPDYFDCSGAVVAGIRKVANPKFGRYTADQLYNNYTTPLPDTGGSGTLIFYNNKVPSNPDGIDHVATYVGNGMIVDPNGTQGQVKLNPASYESNYTTKNGGNVYNAQIDWNEVMSEQ